MSGEHLPMQVKWESRFTMPADVCDTCSDKEKGIWVPVNQCPEASAKLTDDPGSAIAGGYVILKPETDEELCSCGAETYAEHLENVGTRHSGPHIYTGVVL